MSIILLFVILIYDSSAMKQVAMIETTEIARFKIPDYVEF